MVDRMIVARALAVAFAMSCATAGGAQALNDPTRPPLDLAGVVSGGAASNNPLQSILISSGRKGAIIGGQYVPLGGKYGDSRLIRITATEVTLRSAEKTEVLKLFASEAKTPTASASLPMPAPAGRRP